MSAVFDGWQMLIMIFKRLHGGLYYFWPVVNFCLLTVVITSAVFFLYVEPRIPKIAEYRPPNINYQNAELDPVPILGRRLIMTRFYDLKAACDMSVDRAVNCDNGVGGDENGATAGTTTTVTKGTGSS